VAQYLVDHHLILDTGNHLGLTSALRAGRHIDVENPLQALRPGHALAPLFGCLVFVFLAGAAFTTFSRRHLNTVFAVGYEHTMEPGQVDSWLGNQGRQLGDEIQRLENDMRGSIILGRLELVADIT